MSEEVLYALNPLLLSLLTFKVRVRTRRKLKDRKFPTLAEDGILILR